MQLKNFAGKYLCLMFGICLAPIAFGKSGKFKMVYEWTRVDFQYESDSERQHDIDTGAFREGKVAPAGIEVYYGNGSSPIVFVTTPRFQLGVPATLGYVQGYTGNIPKIKPYPNWSFNRNSNSCLPDRLVSVFRVQLDRCGRLWTIDTGRINFESICPPQLLAFDLKTNKVVHRFEFNQTLYTEDSDFVTIEVDIRESCDNAFVYIADCREFSIIVHDVLQRTAWKVKHKTMYPYPDHGTLTIAGDSYDIMDGVLGLALEPYTPGKDRKLFYHALSSITENWVYTSNLRNASSYVDGPAGPMDSFHVYEGKRESLSGSYGIDKNGVAFFGQMAPTSINCWNIGVPYGGSNIQLVEFNPITLQVPGTVIIVDNPRHQQEVWVISSRFQKVFTGTLNPNETNFRIMSVTTDNAVKGTTCRRSSKHHGHDSKNRLNSVG